MARYQGLENKTYTVVLRADWRCIGTVELKWKSQLLASSSAAAQQLNFYYWTDPKANVMQALSALAICYSMKWSCTTPYLQIPGQNGCRCKECCNRQLASGINHRYASNEGVLLNLCAFSMPGCQCRVLEIWGCQIQRTRPTWSQVEGCLLCGVVYHATMQQPLLGTRY